MTASEDSRTSFGHPHTVRKHTLSVMCLFYPTAAVDRQRVSPGVPFSGWPPRGGVVTTAQPSRRGGHMYVLRPRHTNADAGTEVTSRQLAAAHVCGEPSHRRSDHDTYASAGVVALFLCSLRVFLTLTTRCPPDPHVCHCYPNASPKCGLAPSSSYESLWWLRVFFWWCLVRLELFPGRHQKVYPITEVMATTALRTYGKRRGPMTWL